MADRRRDEGSREMGVLGGCYVSPEDDRRLHPCEGLEDGLMKTPGEVLERRTQHLPVQS